MELFRLSRKPEGGEEEKEIVLNTDAEMQAPAQDGTEAKESTPAPEPADIPIQDLLSDLVGVSRRLGITPPARAEPAADEASDVSAEPAADETRDADAEPAADETRDADAEPAADETRDADAERSEEGDAAEPDSSEGPQVTGPSPTGYRRYALHGLLLTLALVAAIGGFFGAERLTRTESTQGSPAQSQDDDSRLPIIVATVPSAAAGQAPTTAEPTPEATPEPAPDLQPAYFLYTAQPGDAVIAIAEAFAISPDYILWNNPDLIYDPNLVLIDQELLIPSVDGIIYRAKPGDTLSAIAALYQIDVESIVDFAPNGLTSPDNAIEGMVLILPGAVPPLLPWPPEVVEPTASEPQPTEPTPTPEAPTPSEPQAMEPTPTAEEPPPFSIGHIYP